MGEARAEDQQERLVTRMSGIKAVGTVNGTTLKAAALPGSAIVAAATVLRLVAPALRLVDDRDRGLGRA